MNPREYVLRIHPTAACKKVVGDDRQWRVYYTWVTQHGSTIHQLLGLGSSSKDAWKASWRSIQLTTLRKFEGNFD